MARCRSTSPIARRDTPDAPKSLMRHRGLFPRGRACRRDHMVKGGSCIFFLCLYLLFFGMVEWAFERAVPPPVITVRWRDVFPELDPVMRELSLCASEIRDRFPLLAASDIYTCDHAARHGALPAGPFAPACAAEAGEHLRAITEPTDVQIQHYKKRDEQHKSQPKLFTSSSLTSNLLNSDTYTG